MATVTARGVGCLAVAVVVLVAAVIGAVVWWRGNGVSAPIPGAQRCVAVANGNAVTVDLDQAYYSAIIVGMSVKRGLPARAGSIAMATVYQETGIRNLDYGDRDSVGLFQQRPSQGWGSEKQLMDPYYATGKFYDALVKVKGWRTGDINDVAQKVQVSGHPEAYRDHERDARILASTLAGETAAGFTCLERAGAEGDAVALARFLRKTLGVETERDKKTIKVVGETAAIAWAAGQAAVATGARFGTAEVHVGGQSWRADGIALPAWQTAGTTLPAGRVLVTVR